MCNRNEKKEEVKKKKKTTNISKSIKFVIHHDNMCIN